MILPALAPILTIPLSILIPPKMPKRVGELAEVYMAKPPTIFPSIVEGVPFVKLPKIAAYRIATGVPKTV
jgi:hypothetical protein